MPRWIFALLAGLAVSAQAHDLAKLPDEPNEARRITFPDTANYLTLVLDPHTHSSFSDGHVWPRIRIEEALRDGLDAIAITEHLEWQPHLADIPHPDRNRAYQVALESAGEQPLMVIPGTEITRSTAAGHINALFIFDANTMLLDYTPEDPSDTIGYYRAMHQLPDQDALDAAAVQGAFMFWNHPWWGDEFPGSIPKMTEFHAANVKAGKIKGIEIANGDFFSEEAFQIALDYDLALIGSSDIHELVDWDYEPHKGVHRPVTLVLAKERSQQAMQAALEQGRTLVWFKNTLAAREPEMAEMLSAALTVSEVVYKKDNNLLSVTIDNHSDVDFRLRSRDDYTYSRNTDTVDVAQHSSKTLIIKTVERLDQIELLFEVQNALIAPRKPATIRWSLPVKELNNVD